MIDLTEDVLEIFEELDGLVMFVLLIFVEEALLDCFLMLEAISASCIFDAHVDVVHSGAFCVEMLNAVVFQAFYLRRVQVEIAKDARIAHGVSFQTQI